WALSYLRGPMTLKELGQLNQSIPVSVANTAKNTAGGGIAKVSAKPVLPAGVNEYYLGNASNNATYVPQVLGVAKVHFVDSKTGVDEWQTRHLLAPLTEDGSGPDWAAASLLAEGRTGLVKQAADGLSYAELPAALLRAQNYAGWSKDLAGAIYQGTTLAVHRCAALKLSSNPGESEGDFRSRLSLSLREQRDAEVERLRKQYAPRLQTLQDQQVRAQQKIEREQSQLSQQKLQTALSVGATILGAFFGRKVVNSTNIGRVATAARSAGRISRESQDVDQATGSLETVRQRLNDLQAELEQEIARVQGELDPAAIALESIEVKPRKTDTVVNEVAVVWRPV
ncbi:MAG: ATP-binding protein, partial [Steroidobacteraceae bacterium]